jgi:hypothetical protein
MRALRFRLADEAKAAGVPLDTVEKDYLIGYLLAGISSSEELNDTLVLKGGTALRKVHFRDYRFSEDLDFSAVGAPQEGQLEEEVRAAVATAAHLLGQQGPFGVSIERYLEREPHPHGQEAFVLRGRFPWQRDALCRIKIEVTADEPVLLPPERRPLLHGYSEVLQCSISCYALEEIVAEKLRTLLQTHQRLATRGWNRPRARDYYDLWRILRDRAAELRADVIPDLLRRKAEHRRVMWSSLEDFFTPELVSEAKRSWNSSLGPFVAELPECKTTLAELRRMLAPIVG